MSSSSPRSGPERELVVDFKRWPAGETYTAEMVKADFAAVIRGEPRIARSHNISIDDDNALSFKQEAGKVAATGGGAQILIPITPSAQYTLEYKVAFDGAGAPYEWTYGGKLPGVGGGRTYFGGIPATAGDGFSARFMFGGGGLIFAYVYHKDMPGSYGDPLGIRMPGAFTSNRWHSVRAFYKVNTGSNYDGVIRAWVDGKLVGERTNLRYSTNGSLIDTLHIALFHGGQGSEYEPSQDQVIKISEIRLSRFAESP